MILALIKSWETNYQFDIYVDDFRVEIAFVYKLSSFWYKREVFNIASKTDTLTETYIKN